MTGFLLSSDLLSRMAERSCIEIPSGDLVFFGIRGLLPLDLSGTDFASEHRVRQADIDNLRMRCTLGQWRPADRTIALFPGSTVPFQNAIATARARGGVGANMLMLGRYRYQKGIHKPGAPSGHRAFRQAMFFPVWRSQDDLDFDLDDRLDLGASSDSFVFDNLHCAFHDNTDTVGYSSNGCQVVAGQPRSARRSNKPETGPWKRFIENAYELAERQDIFGYLLFTGVEAARLAEVPAGEVSKLLRFGSSGRLVREVQAALRSEGFDFLDVDGDFGRDTLRAVMSFQTREFGRGSADGVVGPNTATALGLALPKLQVPGAAPLRSNITVAPTELPDDWQASAIAVTCGFETAGDPFQAVAGDFDGMGISCGALQWNIGQGSLQPLVVAVGEAEVVAAMPRHGAEFWRACNRPVREGLESVRNLQSGSRLTLGAKTELTALMGTAAMRRQQMERISTISRRALDLASRWSAASGEARATKRQFLWFFDLVTQNGGLEGLTVDDVTRFVTLNGPERADDVVCDFLAGTKGNSGHVRDAQANAVRWRGAADEESLPLLIASFLRSGSANPAFRHVVLNRKGTIAMGFGQVNGAAVDLGSHAI